MTAVIAQRAGDQYQFFDEIVLSNSNTPEMMQEINPKTYRGGRPLVLAHADASVSACETCCADKSGIISQ